MPNRIIKESAFTSDRIAALTDFEFRLWVGLITQADDAGRGDARPAIIKGRVFALRERTTTKDISSALSALAAAGCVSLYTVGGKPYYAFPSWAKHQRIRDVKSKFPGPDEGEIIEVQQSAASCGEAPQEAALIQSNPIQSESNPNPNPTRTRSGAKGTDFERFWQAYPRKIGKAAAEKALSRVKVPVDVLIAAVEKQMQSDQWTREAGRYIPNAATWLNQGRWEDELPAKDNSKPAGQYQRSGQPISPMMKDYVRKMMEEET